MSCELAMQLTLYVQVRNVGLVTARVLVRAYILSAATEAQLRSAPMKTRSHQTFSGL